jgi:hypothetical protein
VASRRRRPRTPRRSRGCRSDTRWKLAGAPLRSTR